MIAFVLILFFLVICYDARTLFIQMGTKEKAIYFAALLISFGVLTLYSLSVPVPSPSDAITKTVNFFFQVKQ